MKKILRSLFCLLLATAGGLAFAQDIGRVIASQGDVTLLRQGASLPAPVGTALLEGDTVRTGASANAQLWFSDSSLVVLRNGSEFVVQEYRFDGNNGKLIFNLVKGGLRTLTGQIGKLVSRDSYRVNARVATVGVRGTNYSLLLCQDDCANADGSRAANGLYGGVYDGSIGVSNSSPETIFGRDEYFFVADINSIPQPLTGPPAFLADRLVGMAKKAVKPGKEPATAVAARSAPSSESEPLPLPPATPYAVTDSLGGDGIPAVVVIPPVVVVPPVVIPPVAVPTTMIAVIDMLSLEETSGSQASYNGIVTVPSSNLTVSGTGPTQTLSAFTFQPTTPFSAMSGSSGSDMTGFDSASGIYYGRWINGSATYAINPSQLTPGTQTPGTGIHYMYGTPTADTVLASRTGTIQYNDVAGTTPTDSSGHTASSFSFGPINVNFTSRTGSLSTVTMQFPTTNWSFSNLGFSLQFSAGQVGFDANLINVGSCTGTGCGEIQGSNSARADFAGVFMTSSGNFLALTFAGNSNGNHAGSNTTVGAVRLFKCSSCP